MTYLEIDSAMVSITREKCNECKNRLDAIPKENTTERKAVQLEYGMYTFCGNAGLLFDTGGKREGIYKNRQHFIKRTLHKYPKLNSFYQTLDGE